MGMSCLVGSHPFEGFLGLRVGQGPPQVWRECPQTLSCVVFVSGFAIKDGILTKHLIALYTFHNGGSHFFGGYGLFENWREMPMP